MTSDSLSTSSRLSRWKPRLSAGLFWAWNIFFLAFMVLGFGPALLPELLIAVRTDTIPLHFAVYALILVCVPILGVILGLTALRGRPGKLFALGYGVIDPLLLLLALRFFIIRQANPAVTFLLISAVVGIGAFLWHLLDKRQDQRHLVWQVVRVFGLTLLVLMGLYGSIWLGFYVVPLAAESLNFLGSLLHSLSNFNLATATLRLVPFMILGSILLVFTGSLLIVAPVAIPLLYGRAWLRSLRTFSQRIHPAWAYAFPVLITVLFAAGLYVSTQQPQTNAFAQLDTPPSSPEAMRALLKNEESIRAGLLNSYLAPQRYVGSAGDLRHISRMYRGLGLTPVEAERVQDAYELVAQPVLYRPARPTLGTGSGSSISTSGERPLRAEPPQAAKLYQDYFDEPITEGERDTVEDALRATWSLDQSQANWQTVADREIWLARQGVNVVEHGDWAEVELYEVYENQTLRQQEIVYYFSLPESAVITGVWLGNSADRDQRFAYRVAPRGAAQATYQSQVRRNIDPALVEQIGPSQYRLRVYPVEPMRAEWDETTRVPSLEDAPQLHMWLSWQVLAEGDAWHMPYLSRKFNVYWDDATERLLNGAPMEAADELWLPESVAATQPVTPLARHVELLDGHTISVEPANPATPQVGDLELAVILDRSRSMLEYSAVVTDSLADLQKSVFSVDLYLTSSALHGEDPERQSLADVLAGEIVYFGGQNAAELLGQFADISGNAKYDAILVLTDGTGYETGDPGITVPIPDAPLWMVHLNGHFPIGYDDGTLEAIQASGGGAAGSVDEVLARLQAGRLNLNASVVTDLVDGYLWTALAPDAEPSEISSNDGFITVASGDPFAAFAARRLILAEMFRNHENLATLDTLDDLHSLASASHIVTPYSSMIVLVNDQQHRLLDRLEQAGDRFEREYEEIGETEPNLTVNAVPEPEEWLLLIIAAAMLGHYLFKRRLETSRARAI